MWAPVVEGFMSPDRKMVWRSRPRQQDRFFLQPVAVAIVCAPIVSSVIEQLVHIPVATIIPRDSVQRAIELAARKAWL